MIQGVIFDMDGLMFDTERIWGTLWAPACEQLGLPTPTHAFIEGAQGLAGENMNRYIHAAYPQIEGDTLRKLLWKLADERFAEAVPVKPGLIELLDYLEERHIPCAVASSSRRQVVERNLKNTDTSCYFSVVAGGNEVTHSKPNPEVFLKAAEKLNLPIENCLVLEDSFNGVRAGYASGAVTIMVPDTHQPDEEISKLYRFCCKDLYEVRNLLAAGKI